EDLMTRISPLDHAATTGEARSLLDAVQVKLGMTPALMRGMAHSPATLAGYLSLAGALEKDSLGSRLREKIALTVAKWNGCDYCLAAHATIGKLVGLSKQEIDRAVEHRAEDSRDNAAVQLAVAILSTRGAVSDADLEKARAAGLGNSEIVDVVGNVSL